jgi:leucyl aminopeptidase
MEIDAVQGPLEPGAADTVAFAVAEPARELPSLVAGADALVDGRLSRLAAAGDLSGRWNTVSLVHGDGVAVAAAGLGASERVDADTLRDAAAAVARERPRGSLAWVLDATLPVSLEEQARAVVDGIVLGGYDPGRWKTSDGRRPQIEKLDLVGASEDLVALARRAERVAHWANRARDLSNRPPNDLTPERLAERAFELAGEVQGVTAEALGPDEIRAHGMGSFAAVAQGSHNPARLIVLRYEPPEPRDSMTLGLVGKAITFDTGGISLKPALYMEDMKGDMAGGAAVIESIGAIADLGLPLRTLGVVAATENMPGGGAYRPGDILTAMNGKTIEVINTDAEGRLVLADALWYAREQGATHLLDFATLTGAMELALGDFYAGVFGNDAGWRDRVVEAGEASGDHAWAWPLHRRYRRYVDSAFADMKNASVLRQGSPVLAAEFLQEFVGDGPWAHVDMAGPGFLTRSRGDYLSQPGGTGYGVRLIVELAQRLAA